MKGLDKSVTQRDTLTYAFLAVLSVLHVYESRPDCCTVCPLLVVHLASGLTLPEIGVGDLAHPCSFLEAV